MEAENENGNPEIPGEPEGPPVAIIRAVDPDVEIIGEVNQPPAREVGWDIIDISDDDDDDNDGLVLNGRIGLILMTTKILFDE